MNGLLIYISRLPMVIDKIAVNKNNEVPSHNPIFDNIDIYIG